MARRWPTRIDFPDSVGGGKFDANGGDNTTDKLATQRLGRRGGVRQSGLHRDGRRLDADLLWHHPALSHHRQRPRGECRPAYQVAQGLAPGSYISIFGSDLRTPRCWKDAVAAGSLACFGEFRWRGMSLPGHIHYVSPGQINVQIPGSFRQPSVQMKVTVFTTYCTSGGSVHVPLATYSPESSPSRTESVGADFGGQSGQTDCSIVIWANGLGRQCAAIVGRSASAEPLAHTNATPR